MRELKHILFYFLAVISIPIIAGLLSQKPAPKVKYEYYSPKIGRYTYDSLDGHQVVITESGQVIHTSCDADVVWIINDESEE